MSAVPAKQRDSVSQSHSALGTSSLQNLSAVGSSHSLSEAMLNLALTLLRLICSLHECFTPFHGLLHDVTIYYIHILFRLSRGFLNPFSAFGKNPPAKGHFRLFGQTSAAAKRRRFASEKRKKQRVGGAKGYIPVFCF